MTNSVSARPRRFDRLRLLGTIAIFSVGLSAYLGGYYLDGFPKTILQGIGGLIAVAIGAEFVYSTFLEEVYRKRTLDQIDSCLDSALERALRQSSLPKAIDLLSSGQGSFTGTFDERVRNLLRAEFRSEVDRIIVGSARFGFAGFEDRLKFETLFQSLGDGDELMWLDTYCPAQPKFEQPLRAAVNRGAIVRMLAMDPSSKVLPFRALEIDEELEVNYEPHMFAEEARRSLAGIVGCVEALVRDKPRGSISVRTYHDLPCLPMYLIARAGELSEGYTGFFLTRPTYDEPHVRWTSSPESRLSSFHAYFERKWSQHSVDQVAVAQSVTPNP